MSGRLIPAYAGSTQATTLTAPTSTAHPRLRGEHILTIVDALSLFGSSPLTRGARWARSRGRWVKRLIPAYAGSTRLLRRHNTQVGAHPRLRGEHRNPGAQPLHRLGSSPLTRGGLVGRESPTANSRLIPAYAGSTWHEISSSSPPRAHPRLRGEHALASSSSNVREGSSPLTRGARIRRLRTYPASRLIPAYAGST